MSRSLSLLAALALMAVAAPGRAAAPAPAASVEVFDGVNIYSLPTAHGKVRVILPDDMMAGDTISGTVVLEPAGRDPAEKRANADTLNGYVVDAGAGQARRGSGLLKFVVPAASGGALGLILRDRAGHPVGQIDAPLLVQLPSSPDVRLPVYAQAGRPLEIQGPFDGNADNTSVSVGGQEQPVLAESPRATVAVAPPAPSGPSDISVREGGRTTSGPLHNLRLELSAPKTTLLKGESTELTVQVHGLQGLAQTVPVSLVASPSIALGGGNAQSIAIQPGAASPEGDFRVTRTVRARAPGPFEITGLLRQQQAAPRRDSLFPDALDMNGVDNAKELLSLISSMSDEDQRAILQATLKALKARRDGSDKASTRKWLQDKIDIVEKAIASLG
jgi:hypothetical protein